MKKLLLFSAIFTLTALFANAQTNYDIFVGDVQVTSANMNAITGENINGTVTYDPSTEVLTLNSATINGNIQFNTGSGNGTAIANPVIKLVGTNSLTYIDINNTYASSVTNKLTISGTGSLYGTGLWLGEGIDLLVKDCDLVFQKTTGACCAFGYTENIFTFENANASFKVTGNTTIALSGFKTLNLIGCTIVTPEGAEIVDFGENYGHVVCEWDGTTKAAEVVISRTYDLYLGPEIVTDMNKDNIPCTSGTASFDPATNTLNLNNATIDFIESNNYGHTEYKPVPNLTVVLNGMNNVGAIELECPNNEQTTLVTIKGNGSISSDYLGLADAKTNLLIENTSITADGASKGKDWGLYGYSLNVITIKNSYVKATAEKYALADFGTLTLEGCQIVTPENAQILYDPFGGGYYGYMVCTANGGVATEVIIQPTSGIRQNSAANITVYPNPVVNQLFVNGENIISVSVYDIYGQLILDEASTGNNAIINMGPLSAGQYFVRVNTGDGIYTEKIIKQ